MSSLSGRDHRDQPRVPAGQAGGGQFSSMGLLLGAGAEAKSRQREDRPVRLAQTRLPRFAACTEAAYRCLSNMPSASRDLCMMGEVACNAGVSLVRKMQETAPNLIGEAEYVDGKVVVIPPFGEPFVLPRNDPR
jgi:hypothetical protein